MLKIGNRIIHQKFAFRKDFLGSAEDSRPYSRLAGVWAGLR
jgi:hypothetical protein